MRTESAMKSEMEDVPLQYCEFVWRSVSDTEACVLCSRSSESEEKKKKKSPGRELALDLPR